MVKNQPKFNKMRAATQKKQKKTKRKSSKAEFGTLSVKKRTKKAWISLTCLLRRTTELTYKPKWRNT